MRDEYLADGLSELQVAALDARSKRQAGFLVQVQADWPTTFDS